MREKFDLLWTWRLEKLWTDGIEVDKLSLPVYTEIMCPDHDHPYFSFNMGPGGWRICTSADFIIKRREE
jgi:hypothetical protein